MPDTPSRGYPYPDPGVAPDVPYWLQQLAQDVDADVAANLAPSLVDSGWVTSGIVYATGWAATSGYQPAVRKVGKRVQLRGAITYSSGSWYDRTAITLPSGYRPAVSTWLGTSHTGGGWTGELLLLASGALMFPSGYGDGTATVGAAMPLHGSWFVD